MNYNDYDSNGNKKDFNFSDMINDKKHRSRLILAVYLVLFIILVVMIRTNTPSVNNKTSKDNKPVEENKEQNSETDSLFSLVDTNNYEFDYHLKYAGETYIANGKRYNNKYSFTFTKEGETSIEFLGTTNHIVAIVDGEEQTAGLPYRYLDYFDNNLLKNILANASKVEDSIYAITNNKISSLSSDLKSIKNDSINTIRLDIKNGNIIGIEIDYSNAVSEFLNEQTEAIITISFNNFNLVDDFSTNFE